MFQYSFSYHKNRVIQGLRRHFISRKEIRLMVILVNAFAIISAVLYFMKKIRPEPFFMGSFIWLFLIVGIFYLLPYSIYKKEKTFRDRFTLFLFEDHLRLENPTGYVNWQWTQFKSYVETDHFFHLYFSSKAFFLLPKEDMPDDFKDELRRKLKIHSARLRF